MQKKINTNQSGFTIVETLIVLAIVGAIMLVVFLAVPALQRNSRNTQIRNDAASVLSTVNEFATNNNGNLPETVTADVNTGAVTATSTVAGSVPANGRVRAGTTVSRVATHNAASTTNITVRLLTICTGNTATVSTNNRAFAATFTVETGGSPATADQCVAS